MVATGVYRADDDGICFLLHEEMVIEKKRKSITVIFDLLFIKQPTWHKTSLMQLFEFIGM